MSPLAPNGQPSTVRAAASTTDHTLVQTGQSLANMQTLQDGTPTLLTEAEAASRLRMSCAWLAREARNNRVPHVQLGSRRWYRPEHVEQIIAAATRQPSEISVSARRRQGRAS